MIAEFSFDLIVDAIDILIVSFLLYRLFSLMRGTRAVHMFFGLILLFVLSVIAQLLNLIGINWLVSSLRTVWVIAFVIIFQPELRRALAMLGQNRVLSRFVSVQEAGIIPEIVRSAAALVDKNLGGLIVTPGVSFGMIIRVALLWGAASMSVFTMAQPYSLTWAPVLQIFCPLTTKSSPSSTAVVFRETRSEPAFGSL